MNTDIKLVLCNDDLKISESGNMKNVKLALINQKKISQRACLLNITVNHSVESGSFHLTSTRLYYLYHVQTDLWQ